MAALGKLVVSLSANIAEFTSAMDKAAFVSAKRMETMQKAAKMAGAAIGGALVAGAGALANELRKFADAADATTKASQSLGMSVKALQELRYAAELSGVASNELDTALGKLSKKAADGNDAFRAMGIQVKNSDGTLKSADKLVGEVADKFSTYADGAAKTALAQSLFEESGARLIPMLNNGSAGLAAMADEAQKLGFVFDAETGKAAERFNDNLTRLGKITQGTITQVAAGMLPAMEKLSAMMVEASKNTEFFSGVANVLNGTLKALITTGSVIWGVFEMVGSGLAGLAAAAVLAAKGEFRQAYDALNMSGKDMVTAVQDTVDRTMAIWSDANTQANAIANSPTGGLAAPVVSAVKKTDEAAKELEAKQKQILSIITAAQDSVSRLTLGDDQMATKQLERLGASPEQIAALQAAQVERAKLLDLDRQLDEATKQAEENDRQAAAAKEALRQAGIRVYEDTRTPAEKLNIELARLDELLAKGAISWDTYSRAQMDAQENFDKLSEKGKDSMSELTQAVEAWGSRATDAFIDFAFTGKATFSDLVNSMLKDLARMMLQKNVTTPIFDAISSSAGGWFKGLFSFDGGGYTGSGARSGGMDGKGGFMAMLHPNETVLDHTRGQTGTGGGTQVVINNYSGAQATASETVDSRGNRRIDVTISEMVAGEMSRPGSSVNAAVRNSFGARPALVGR